MSTSKRITNSAVWAAYADALGFITELTDLIGLRRRAQVDKVVKTVQWKRLVGGRFGALVPLPVGCYSDDTQLRLSTARAIQGDGNFDVEAFAKVELPVWLSYALGGGSGTKAAASNLAGPSVNWFSNFFASKTAAYLQGGGNGAAMRIQPHVWAARNRSRPDSFLLSVVKNAICTHGHARGFFGAALHASTLAEVLDTGSSLAPVRWTDAVRDLSRIEKLIRQDRELGAFWLPVWEERAGTTLERAIESVIKETLRDICAVEQFLNDASDSSYRNLLGALGCLDKSSRGSGTKTVIAALALCWMYRDRPEEALVTAVNVLESDTDTIATLAAAMMGATVDYKPTGELLDREYIETEAVRLHAISMGKTEKSFKYPDLMAWIPPRLQSDAVGRANGDLVVTGLGKAIPLEGTFTGQGREAVAWRWLKLDFGQSILAKMRLDPAPVRPANVAVAKPVELNNTGKESSSQPQTTLFPLDSRTDKQSTALLRDGRTLDELTSEAIRNAFDPSIIGHHILLLADRPNGIELGVAYVSIVAKAKKARSGRHS